jgi:hypothetical protein
MPALVDLTTADTAAAELGIAADSPGLDRLITAASTAIASWLGYPVQLRDPIVETVSSSAGPFLFLRGGALKAIASIAYAGTTLDPSSYRIDNAIRGRVAGYGFPFTGSSSIGVAPQELHAFDTGKLVVTYSAGWVTPGMSARNLGESDLPSDIEQAALEVITAWHRRRGRDGDLTRVDLGDASLIYHDGKQALPVTARTLLAAYRKRIA